MSTHNLYVEPTDIDQEKKRVVEAEIKLPKLEDLSLPHVNLEPVRSIAEDVLVTTLGIGVLVTRGVISAVKAAHDAGVEAAQEPDSWVNRLVTRLKPKEDEPELTVQPSARVPMLPIDDYDELAADEIDARIEALDVAQLGVLRAYEVEHQNRADVIATLDSRLGA